MKKVERRIIKEERKDNLNEPLVIIEQDSVLTKKRIISYPFNKEKKNSAFEKDAKKSNEPGPGAYNIISNKAYSQNVVSKISRFPNDKNNNPGVGEYNVAESEIKVENTAPKYHIPKAERKNPFEVSKESKNIPGTGSYNIQIGERKGIYIESKNQRFSSSNNGKPGVGEYDINDAELKLKKKTGISSVKSKRKDPFEVSKESKNVPGTGAYNINKLESKGFYIEGKKKRFETSYNGKPGVGEYDINDAEIKLKKKTGISTSKSVRKDPFEVGKERKTVPGIGTYNVNTENRKGFYIEENVPRFTSSNNGKPGVGEYDINEAALKLKKKTGISTAKSKRKDPFEVTKESKNVPGAGAYNTIDTSSHKFYIEENIPRFASSNNGKPGVGEYNINEAALKLKKKTGISTAKSKRKDPFEATKESKNIPGAGAYNTIEAGNNRFYIETNIPRFTSSYNGKPGVGEYDINDAFNKLKKKTPIPFAGKSKRKDPFEVNKEQKGKPGAGSYNINSMDKKNFYMDENIPRFASFNNGKPGVGEYDINDAELKLKKKTGIASYKSKRADPFEASKESKNIPGTGSYNINKTEPNKFYMEQNIERFGPSGNKNPGVGEYDINEAALKLKKKTGISTAKSKRKDPFEATKESKNVPGTGAYNINKTEPNKFYMEQNIERFGPSGNKNPGVGEYDINDAELKLKKKTGISTVKSTRKDPFEVTKESKNVPGTGSYNINKTEPNKFYMEQKLERFGPSGNKNPGVGEYNINDAELKLKKRTGISTVKSSRKDPFEVSKESKNVPGTGSYNINKLREQKFYIEGNVPRFTSSNNGKPGVGEYDINDAELKLKKKTGISIAKSKRKDPFEATKESRNIPGTGTYNINKTEPNKFYMDQKLERFGPSGNKNPGVGEYDINEAAIKLKKKTGISKVKSERKDPFEVGKENKNIPGVGSYNINKLENNKFYIEQNIERFGPSGNKNPGVGEYDINDASLKLKKKTGISTTKSKRVDPFEVTKESKNVPGTGSYNINKTEPNKFYMEQNIERFGPSGNKNPGVGEYDINDAELKLKKKTGISTVKSTRKDPFEVSKESKNVPGTGSYNINKLQDQKFYIEGNIPRFTSSNNGKPGVGEYDINDAELKLKKKTGISSAKSKRKDPFEATKESKNVPGAGAYNINKAGEQKFYIEGNVPRFTSSNNGKPGVGEYNINEAALKLKKKTGISTAKSKRKDPFEATKESKNVPGTGAYNINKTEPNKFYMEQNIERFGPSGNKNPGVGEYNINDAELKLKKKTGISTVKSTRKDPFEVSKESKNVPGTGSYNINKLQEQKFYIEKNIERFSSSNNGKPGVGEYDINEAELKLKKKTGISTAKSKRVDPFEVTKESKNIPGTGSYNINKTEPNKFYMEQNIERFGPSGNKNPGVGEYDINDAELKLKKKTGISTVKSTRKDPFEVSKESKNVPGTGSYNINKLQDQKFYIEQNIERFSSSNNGKPGVGEYDINDAELKLKKKTGIASYKSGRKDPFEATKESKNIPGTGAYYINKGDNPKFYIEPKIDRLAPTKNNNPGVGEYNHSEIEIKLKPKAPEFVEPKAERKDLFEKNNNNEKVGPGSYEVRTEDNKSGFQKFSTLPRKI